ncbi:MAG: site-specific DNA-methyltransferase [Acidovorax sp.]|nr:site-specific DNA-methyltransferase [Acidovorax sp.]
MPEIEKLTLNDPETQSADIVAGNLAALQALFPEAFSEGRIDFEVLKQVLGGAVDDREEKYGLNWHGKRRARQIALTPSTGTLLPCPQDSVDWDTTQNLMIEGDNLEVLKLLQKSYAGKVKLITIDPPYNTGKDFVYPDDFKDSIGNYLGITGQIENGRRITSNTETSGRFHTDWLSMMYPRLKLARNLLKSTGWIAVSVDDSEVSNLKKLLDEIFGEENFIANIVWQKKYTRANDAQFFSANHDHVLVFAKSRDSAILGRVERGESQIAAYGNPDKHPKGIWKATPLHARSGSNTGEYTFKNGVKWAPPTGTYRRYSDQTMKELEQDNAIWFGVDGKQVPQKKSFLQEMDEGMVPVTIWDHKFAGNNHDASNELKSLNMGGVFTSPKPTQLILRELELFSKSDEGDVVLDFFAGSGTSGHAVMLQNKADGGDRKFILVQLPEQLDGENKDQKVAADFCIKNGLPLNIAELTKERLRRAAPQVFDGGGVLKNDQGFRVYKLASSNIRAWEPVAADLENSLLAHAEHLVPGRTEAAVLTELLLKLGLDLCVAVETQQIAGMPVHSIGAGALIACLSDGITRDVAEALGTGIAAWRKALNPAVDTRVVFKDSGFADNDAKLNMAAILTQAGISDMRSL